MADNTPDVDVEYNEDYHDDRPIGKRILQVMRKATYIQKTGKNEKQSYNYVSHDSVVEKLQPLFVEFGIVCQPTVIDKEMRIESVTNRQGNTSTQVFYNITMRFEFCCANRLEDKLTVEAVGMGIDPGDKASGKAMSYAKKNALLHGFMLATGDETDRDQDQQVGKALPSASAYAAEKGTESLKHRFNQANKTIEKHLGQEDANTRIEAIKSDNPGDYQTQIKLIEELAAKAQSEMDAEALIP